MITLSYIALAVLVAWFLLVCFIYYRFFYTNPVHIELSKVERVILFILLFSCGYIIFIYLLCGSYLAGTNILKNSGNKYAFYKSSFRDRRK